MAKRHSQQHLIARKESDGRCWPHPHALPTFSLAPNPDPTVAEVPVVPKPVSVFPEQAPRPPGEVWGGLSALEAAPGGAGCHWGPHAMEGIPALSLDIPTAVSARLGGCTEKNKQTCETILVKLKKRLKPDLFSQGLMPLLYFLMARTTLRRSRPAALSSLPVDIHPTQPFCLPQEHPNHHLQLPVPPDEEALLSRVRGSFIQLQRATAGAVTINGLKIQIVVTAPTTS